jgi:hypothetical protein
MFAVTAPAPRRSTAGFTTVESLVALIMFAVGVLGAVGTVGLATRALWAGAAASEAARLISTIGDSLAGAVVAGGGRCASLAAGSRAGTHGVSAGWRPTEVPGGVEIELTAFRPSLGRPHTDTVAIRFPCHS